jgi:hypothetical protein
MNWFYLAMDWLEARPLYQIVVGIVLVFGILLLWSEL